MSADRRSARARWGLAVSIGMVAACVLPCAAAAQSVEARLDRSRIAAGETTTLRVVVRGGQPRDPEIDVPPGVAVISSGRQQSFSWINGRASTEVEFRYEIEGRAPGRHEIGPVIVQVGSQAFRSGVLVLEVGAPPALGAGDSRAPATLQVVVEPRDPYVGQEMSLKVRLVQRASFAEDPQYTPPSTTGFWTDRPTTPESFYAEERGQRVLVTETRARLYPLATGRATIGEATAQVVLAEGSGPFGWLVGDRRELVLRSAPVAVRVRSLPAVAPTGFTGAVGDFDVAWSADRSTTSRDVPVTVRLDIRGRGNLPLIRPPLFRDPDVDVFASSVDDSLPSPGAAGSGRKRFQWTLLPKREGALAISAPEFAWFDPSRGGYALASHADLEVEVGAPVFTAAGAEAGFPRALADRPVDPGAVEPSPWAFTLAGALLGASILLWRRASAAPRATHDAEVWRGRLRAATGPSVWKAAEEAVLWLETLPASSASAQSLRQKIAAARYGGSTSDAEPVRRELQGILDRIRPAGRGALSPRVVAIALGLAALASAAVGLPRPGPDRWAAQSASADQLARRGEVDRARAVWSELWRRSGGHPGLAARIAWAHVQVGAIGPAALWVLRGELVEPRDPSVGWVAQRVREAGGLVGASVPRWPVRRLEWSVAGLLLALAAALVWPRRAVALACLGLALVAALAHPAQGFLAGRSGRAVVLQPSALEGSDVELEPGQMVLVRTRQGARVHVTAGRVIDGWVPAGSVARVAPPRGLDG